MCHIGEHGAESMEQRVGSREWGAESGEQRVGSKPVKNAVIQQFLWWRCRELNPGHYGYEPYALTN